MRITPIEIRQKTFEKSFRGYNKEDVDAFLSSLSSEWESMQVNKKQLEERIKQLEEDLKKLREVEEGMYKALKTAEDTGANVVSQAQKSAELHVKEAEMKAESIIKEARWQAKNIINDAEQDGRRKYEERLQEVREIEREYASVSSLKLGLISDLKEFVAELNGKIERYEANSDLKKLEEGKRKMGPQKTTPNHGGDESKEDTSFFDQL